MVGFRQRGRAPLPATSSLSLRWRVMLLAMSMVAMVVVLISTVVYAVILAALHNEIDNQLDSRVQLLRNSGLLEAEPGTAIQGIAYSSDVNAMLWDPANSKVYKAELPGQKLPIGPDERAVIRGDLMMSRRTASDQRILAERLPNGTTLLISKSLAATDAVMTNLRWALVIVAGIGLSVAAVAGGMVARAGLRPVGRLTEAAERVGRTEDLRPIPVFGSDELSRLTEAFNMMLRALAESRERQARLVTDAGHELRTPLTSLRTNVELLMASMEPGAPPLPEQEMVELRGDVIAQIEELSTLVGDLVDLTRDDGGQVVHEVVDLSEVIERSQERVRRRRNDIHFDVRIIPWQVYGDAAGLSRATLNLMDNAAKWSPPFGRVGVTLRQLDPSHAELIVSDLGPGIPPQERRLVFERFYRSTTARAMPGSGLGLAIVKKVVLNHGGLLRVEDTVPGGQPPGTSIYVLLPGRPMPSATSYAEGPDTTNRNPKNDSKSEARTDPAFPLDADQKNSRDSTNVISDDSQSTRTR